MTQRIKKGIRSTILVTLLVGLDLLGVTMSLMLTAGFTGGAPTVIQWSQFLPLYLLILLLYSYQHLYTQRYDFWHETRLLLKATLLAWLLFVTYMTFGHAEFQLSKTFQLLSLLFLLLIQPTVRRLGKYTLYQLGLWQEPALVYGEASSTHQKLFENFYLGYVPVSTQNQNASTVFIEATVLKREQIVPIIEQQLSAGKKVIFIPILNQFDYTHSNISELFDARLNLINLQNRLNHRTDYWLKTIINYLLTLMLLPMAIPLMVGIALLIRLDSPGSVLYKQKRVGKGGRLISIYKFRTMYPDAEQRLQQLLAKNEALAHEWQTHHKLTNDPRITPIGRFLRKTSLDELPQLINVLQGKMQLVGPRPVTQQELVQHYQDNAKYYKIVHPGITGLWQVSGRSQISYAERVQIDRWYVVNWSLWLDIVILIRTFKVVIKQEGAY